MKEIRTAFSDPQAVARYAGNPPRQVPGFHDLLRMAGQLLGEHCPVSGQVLVLGAGGGLDLRALAQHSPGWHFDGVDPSAEMLDLAVQTLGDHADRVRLHHGKIDVAPPGPYDAAACLLTFHFMTLAERGRTLAELHRRLAPGAPFVIAHLSFPQAKGAREQWLRRYAGFAVGSGIDPAKAEQARAAVAAHLTILAPEEDEAMLRAAGFEGVSLFYAGLTFRGWVAYA